MEVLLSVKSKSDGSRQEVRCAVNGGITLGRNPQSPLPLDGTGISRDHIRFEADGPALAVIDLSSNGTWINGKRISRGRPVALKENDFIEVPGYEIRFQLPSAEPAPARSTAAPIPTAAPALTATPKSSSGPGWLGSFTPLERFTAVIAALSLVLVALFLSS